MIYVLIPVIYEDFTFFIYKSGFQETDTKYSVYYLRKIEEGVNQPEKIHAYGTKSQISISFLVVADMKNDTTSLYAFDVYRRQ